MLLIVSIPHQRSASAWLYEDKAAFIERVYNMHDCFVYGEETKESLIAIFGDVYDEDGDLNRESYLTSYPELAELLAKSDKVIEVKKSCNEPSEWYLPASAPSEYEVACEVAGDDLHAFYTFETLDEAVSWAKSYRGHQDHVVRPAVYGIAEREGVEVPE